MDNNHTDIMLEMLRSHIADSLMEELDSEDDESVALRKALLLLIMLVQDEAPPTGTAIIQKLLTEFPPLSEYFIRNDFQLLRDLMIGRRIDDNNNLVLTMPREYADSLFESIDFDTFLKEHKHIQDMLKSKAEEELKWRVEAPRFVGFYDIMGFRSLVDNNQNRHELLYEKLLDLHEATVRAEGWAPKVHLSDGKERELFSGQIRAIQFSDSILAITRDDSDASHLLIILASLMFFLRALSSGIPVRGAIAVGNVTADIDNSIYFGQPIIDAYLLEEDQKWYGVVEHEDVSAMHRSDEKDIEDIPQLGPEHIPTTESFIVPRKSGDAEMIAVNWPVIADSYESIRIMLSRYEHKDNEKLNSYYRKTLEFAKHSWSKYRAD